MTTPFNILSYGAGVNSTACLLMVMEDSRFLELRQGVDVIFADTGGEWPETYSYIERVIRPYIGRRWGLDIQRVAAVKPLEQLALEERMAPARVQRWCTDKAKIRPIHAYYKRMGRWPIRQILGIDYGELHRMRDSGDSRIENIYPLVDARMDRDDCKALIRAHGLPVPPKSGCFYCPFQRRRQWVSLARRHPRLFTRAVRIEETASKFNQGFYLSDVDHPLRQWVPRRLAQGELFPDVPEEDLGWCMHGCEVEDNEEGEA